MAVRLKNDLGKRHAPPLSTSMDMKEYPWPVFTICPFSDNDKKFGKKGRGRKGKGRAREIQLTNMRNAL